MKIIACFKAVSDTDGISVNFDRSLSFGPECTIGQYDFNAIEAAMQLKAAVSDSTVTLATVCAEESRCTSKIRKAALSRGPDELCALIDPALASADVYMTARALAAVVNKLGGADIVICGEGSGDDYNQQTGNILGALLGWNTLNAVAGIRPAENGVCVLRNTEYDAEEYYVPFPAVLSVTADINQPRIPSLRDIMGAGKKPAAILTPAELSEALCAASETLYTMAPEQTERRRDIVTGDDEAAVSGFYDKLRKLL